MASRAQRIAGSRKVPGRQQNVVGVGCRHGEDADRRLGKGCRHGGKHTHLGEIHDTERLLQRLPIVRQAF